MQAVPVLPITQMRRFQSRRCLVGLLALAAVLAVSGGDGAAGDDGAALAGARGVRRALQVRAPSPSVLASALFPAPPTLLYSPEGDVIGRIHGALGMGRCVSLGLWGVPAVRCGGGRPPLPEPGQWRQSPELSLYVLLYRTLRLRCEAALRTSYIRKQKPTTRYPNIALPFPTPTEHARGRGVRHAER
jgi:hypothetical protein